MPRSDLAIRQAKPGAKPYKLADGGGMYLLVNPSGSKLWRCSARDACITACRKHAGGIDPIAEKKEAKQARTDAAGVAADAFGFVAREWLRRREAQGDMAATTISKDLWRLASYLLPAIGHRPINETTALDLRDVLKTIENAGSRETSSWTKMTSGPALRWAVLEGTKTLSDLAASLRGLFATPTPHPI